MAEISVLAPGRALDVGCGEGADALWLARHGWDVAALDVSQVALERAAWHTDDAAAEVRWVRSGMVGAPITVGRFDLVCAMYPALAKTPSADAESALIAAVPAFGHPVAHPCSRLQVGAEAAPCPGRKAAVAEQRAVEYGAVEALPGDPPFRRPQFGKGGGVEAECLLEHLPGADIPVRKLIGSYGQARLPEGVLVQHQALHHAEQCAQIAAELTAAGCHAGQVGLLPGDAVALQQVRHHTDESRADSPKRGDHRTGSSA